MMDDSIFKKLKVKAGMTGVLLHVPPEYPSGHGLLAACGPGDFVHLFVKSRGDFDAHFAHAAAQAAAGAIFWLSYPKSTPKAKHDINRDSLWDLLLAQNYHPVAQISLGETWSAMRIKPNETGKTYERPANTHKK